jgi:hypothetical protein
MGLEWSDNAHSVGWKVIRCEMLVSCVRCREMENGKWKNLKS